MKKRMNSSEQDAMLHLRAAYNALDRVQPLIDRGVPHVSAMLNGARGGVFRATQLLLDTLPDEQLAAYYRNSRAMAYAIKVRSVAVRGDDDGYWLSMDALETLLKAARETCIICTKDPQQQRMCPLGKCFNEIPIARGDMNSNGCGYSHGL